MVRKYYGLFREYPDPYSVLQYIPVYKKVTKKHKLKYFRKLFLWIDNVKITLQMYNSQCKKMYGSVNICELNVISFYLYKRGCVISASNCIYKSDMKNIILNIFENSFFGLNM